jgi:hypothetical protein
LKVCRGLFLVLRNRERLFDRPHDDPCSPIIKAPDSSTTTTTALASLTISTTTVVVLLAQFLTQLFKLIRQHRGKEARTSPRPHPPPTSSSTVATTTTAIVFLVVVVAIS